MIAQIRCPSPPCSAVFDIPAERLGRNIYCLSCGKRMTARPMESGPELREREREVRGGDGADIRRLPVAVLLEDVRSLWNVGSIFRTADACGVERVLLTGITGCPPRREISKTRFATSRRLSLSTRSSSRRGGTSPTPSIGSGARTLPARTPAPQARRARCRGTTRTGWGPGK